MAKKDKKECECGKGSALFIPAGIFIGMGVGFLANNLPAGLFIGMGAGFVAFAIAKLTCKCNCKK